jgi:hypothetical protein
MTTGQHRRSREREPSARVKRPASRRHWPLTRIGEPSWWRQVSQLRVSRDDVERALDDAAPGGDRTKITPHAVRPGGRPAEHAATYILLATYIPEYATMMYVPHVWRRANRSLKEWVVAQYAALITGTDREREAAMYSLWVDYFEVPGRAEFVFPRLLKQVSQRDVLLANSGPVPWATKRAAYAAAAREPELHAALARGLCGSFFDVFGSVEPVEARDLFRAIVVEDELVRAELERVTTQPTRWRLRGLIRVDQRDPRWRKWLPPDAEPGYLIALAPHERPTWVPRSELVHDGRRLGQLRHVMFPFDPAIEHTVEGTIDGTITLFRIEGDPGAALRALGADVEAWPPGLAPERSP